MTLSTKHGHREVTWSGIEIIGYRPIFEVFSTSAAPAAREQDAMPGEIRFICAHN
jgi:hypothetical protein